jgi:hypothetical protein
MSEAGFMLIFPVVVLWVSMPGIPCIDRDSPDMSVTPPDVWPEARKDGTIRHDRFTNAIKSSFRTNISLA